MRSTEFWLEFNTWYKKGLEGDDGRPPRSDVYRLVSWLHTEDFLLSLLSPGMIFARSWICRWYDENAERVWPDALTRPGATAVAKHGNAISSK